MRDSPPVAAARRRLCASISSRIGVVAGAGDLGGHAQRGGHHLAVDHHQPQIVAGRALLDQHLGVLFAGPGQRRVQLVGAVDADGDALALFAAGRLDDDVADLVEERVVVLVEGGQPALGHLDSGLGDEAPGQPLVVASAIATAEVYSDNDSRVMTLRPPCDSRISPALGVEHLDPDPAAHGLVGDDPRVRVEVVDGLRRMGEQRFVDGVLALDRHHRHAFEAQLLVQRDGGGVVVGHRQIHVGAAPVAVERGERAGQRGADAGQAGRRVDGQRPQARAVLRIGEQPLVVDAGDGAHQRPVVVADRDEIVDRITVFAGCPRSRRRVRAPSRSARRRGSSRRRPRRRSSVRTVNPVGAGGRRRSSENLSR